MKLTWNKRLGSRAQLVGCTSFGLYATAPIDGGQARIWISRRMVGDRGRRSYHYTFSASTLINEVAADLALPDNARSDPAKAMAAVDALLMVIL